MTPTRPLAGVLAVAAVLGVTACGQRTAGPASPGADVAAAGHGSGTDDEAATGQHAVRLGAGADRPGLVCPTVERSVMIADPVHAARGARTPQGAVGVGLTEAGEQLVLSARGTTAWVLRADGTARTEVELLDTGNGWLLHRRTSCG